jgi:hypothetical protein
MDVLFWGLTQRLLALGQNVVLESGFWLRSDRDEKRLVARGLGARVELQVVGSTSRSGGSESKLATPRSGAVPSPSPALSSRVGEVLRGSPKARARPLRQPRSAV